MTEEVQLHLKAVRLALCASSSLCRCRDKLQRTRMIGQARSMQVVSIEEERRKFSARTGRASPAWRTSASSRSWTAASRARPSAAAAPLQHNENARARPTVHAIIPLLCFSRPTLATSWSISAPALAVHSSMPAVCKMVVAR